jgi:hypothetical protein
LHSPFVFAQSSLIGVEVRSTAPVFDSLSRVCSGPTVTGSTGSWLTGGDSPW